VPEADIDPVLKLPYLDSLPDTNGEVQVGVFGLFWWTKPLQGAGEESGRGGGRGEMGGGRVSLVGVALDRSCPTCTAWGGAGVC
jgi:hypothetical protein